MKYKTMRRITTVLLYAIAVVPSINGLSNATSLRRGNLPDRLAAHEDAMGSEDEQPQTIKHRTIHRRRQDLYQTNSRNSSRKLKSTKSTKTSKDDSARHHNIFIHDNNHDGSISGQITNSTQLTNFTQMRMTDSLSQHTTAPLERNVATYVPMPAPIVIPTRAPIPLPPRAGNDLNPPTRTGISEPVDIVDIKDPCDEMEERDSIYSQYLANNDDGNNDVTGTDDTEEVVTDQGTPPVANNEQMIKDPVTRPPLNADDKEEEEVVTDKETDIIEQLIQDSVSGDKHQGNDPNSREAWKYVLVSVGALLLIVFAIFLKFRKPKQDIYGYKGGRGDSIIMDPIDNTIPLDQTDGGNSGYSEMNSTKSFTNYEQSIKAPVDFGNFERQDASRMSPRVNSRVKVNSPPQSPLESASSGSRSLYESTEEGNIEEYDDDEEYDEELEESNVFDEEYEDDEEYLSHDETFDEEELEEEDKIDETDMEESTLSWEEEEYLSTIDEESGELGW